MFRVYNRTDNKMTDTVWSSADAAISSCQYLTDTHQKDYIVLATIYSSKDHKDSRLAKLIAAENAKYGND